MQKKFLSAAMAAAMALTACVPAFASSLPAAPTTGDKEGHKGENNVPVTLNVLPQNKPIARFSVTVPTALPLVMDLSGNVVEATNARVKNNSNGDVQVTDVRLSAADGWALGDYLHGNIKDMVSNTKVMGMKINECPTTPDGLQFNPEKFPVIGEQSQMAVVYDALIPRQRVASNVGTVANSVFVIGWADATIEDSLKPHANGTEIDNEKLAAAVKNLTGSVIFSRSKYVGDLNSGATDVSAASDQSVVCVVDDQNATIYGDGGVKVGANAANMFKDYKAATLDVSGLDTRAVTDMSGMFQNTASTVISGLHCMDTDNVTTMANMFNGSKAETLDLLAFNTVGVSDMTGMFQNAAATSMNLTSFNTDGTTLDNILNGSVATHVFCRNAEERSKLIASVGFEMDESNLYVGRQYSLRTLQASLDADPAASN